MPSSSHANHNPPGTAGSAGRRIACLGLLVLCLLSAPAMAGDESLGYRAYYQGLLSAMARIPIVDIRLDNHRDEDTGLQVSTLSLTSEHHSLMEAFYPVRYRLRSIYRIGERQLLGYERYKRGRKVKHDLVVVDALAGKARVLLPSAAATAALPSPLLPWLSSRRFAGNGEPAMAVPAGVLDRLTLLQAARDHLPAAGQALALQVTDGKKLFDYRVVNEGGEVLEIAGRPQHCWRLRIEGFLHRPDDTPEEDHEPVHVWLSADARRLPVRFHSDAALGGFTVTLEAEPLDFSIEMTDQPLRFGSGDSFDEG